MRISGFTETILSYAAPGFSGAPFAVAGFLPLVKTVLLLRARSIAHLRSVDFFWGRTMAGTDDFRNVCLRFAELSAESFSIALSNEGTPLLCDDTSDSH